MQHTRPLVAPAQGPNAFGPGAAMAPAQGARQGLLSANNANNVVANSSNNSSSLLFIQQVESPLTCSEILSYQESQDMCTFDTWGLSGHNLALGWRAAFDWDAFGSPSCYPLRHRSAVTAAV